MLPNKGYSDTIISVSIFGCIKYASYPLLNVPLIPTNQCYFVCLKILWGFSLKAELTCDDYFLLVFSQVIYSHLLNPHFLNQSLPC